MPQQFKTLAQGLSYEDRQRVCAWIIRRGRELAAHHGKALCLDIQRELIPVLPADTRPTINAIHMILSDAGIPHSEAMGQNAEAKRGQLSFDSLLQAGDLPLEPEGPPILKED